MESNSNSNEIDENLIINTVYYEQLKDQLTCSICCGLLNEPMMCENCETPYCANCINPWFKNNKSCPMRCSNAKIKDINRSIKKLLDGLKLKCKYGCEVSLLSYMSHLKLCENSRKEVDCWNCGKKCKLTEMKLSNEVDYEQLKKENAQLKEELAMLKGKNIRKAQDGMNFAEVNLSSNSIILVESDISHIKTWIGVNCSLELIYQGSRDGYSSTDFHRKCDEKGHTVVVMLTSFNKVIGGFSAINWTSPSPGGYFYKDEECKCFLFSLTLKKKYPLLSSNHHAICCNKNYGPIFGSYDLLTVTDCNVNKCLNFDIGACYNYNGIKAAFYGGTPYHLREIEVFKVSY